MAAAKGNNYTLKRKVNPQYTEEQLEDLANDLLDYAENAKSIHLAPWCRKQGKSTSWLNKLVEDHEIIKAAHKHAKELLSAKVVNSCFYGEGNATVGMAYLPVYDKDFRAMLEWKAKLAKHELSESEANIIVQAISYAKKDKE